MNVGAPNPPGWTAPTPSEIAGASRIRWGALLGVLGLALAIGGLLIILLDVGLGIANISASGYVNLLRTIFEAFLIVVVGVVLALLSFVLYTAGFASLRQADRGFRTPMVLCILGLLGLVLIAGFFGVYAAAINSAIACPTNDATCQNSATALGHGIVVLGYLGGLLGFIGLIGAIVGLYRFGARYSSSLAKVGAILYIIPFLSLLAPILVFVGAHGVVKRLTRAPMAAPGMPPMSPAPPTP